MSASSSSITNGSFGAYGSGGSVCNPMYRNVCTDGVYVRMTSRTQRRLNERLVRKENNKLKNRISIKKDKSNSNLGFGSY